MIQQSVSSDRTTVSVFVFLWRSVHNLTLIDCHTEDSYQQQAVIDGEAALLDILDTAGQVEFTAMRDQYMRCGEGFIICYSVTDRHSFQEASEYRKLIARVRLTEDIPLVLIANKLDLEIQRKVTTEEGKQLATQLGCPFYETSAALRHYIDDAFYTLIREIRRKEAQRVCVCVLLKDANFNSFFLWFIHTVTEQRFEFRKDSFTSTQSMVANPFDIRISLPASAPQQLNIHMVFTSTKLRTQMHIHIHTEKTSNIQHTIRTIKSNGNGMNFNSIRTQW